MNAASQLRASLAQGAIVIPGIYDCLSARLAQHAGFKALHLSGMAVEATQLGSPDMGLISAGELITHASRIAATVDIPIIADIDAGFGGVNNIARTIREMERAGIAGVHLEDQVMPKRCPVLEGRSVVSREVATARLKAALDARTNPDFVIVARTDGDVVSIDEAVERSNLYLEAGADLAMPSFMNVNGQSYTALSPDEQIAVQRDMLSRIDGPVMSIGFSPPSGYTAADLIGLGFQIVLIGGAGVFSTANALAEVFREIRQSGTDEAYFERNQGPYSDPVVLMKALRLDEYVERETRFA